LVIRVRDGRYHLAGWPGEGDRHAENCDFHKSLQLSGRDHYTAQAIEETEQGMRIRLAMPLQLQQSADALSKARTPTGDSATSKSRRAVGLLGMLHLMWDLARLSEWRQPDQRRTWRDCQNALHEEAAACIVNDTHLSAILYVVPPYQPDTAKATAEAFDRFQAGLGEYGSTIRRGLILGEIKLVAPASYGHRISLRHLPRPLFAEAALLDRVRSSYRAAFARTLPHQARQIVLAIVERTRSGYLRVIDMAGMLTNAQFLPGESSYEVLMADHLIAAGRAFTKPLRYEAGDAAFPDFVLVDVQPQMCVEVYGVRGMHAYEQRKRAKRAYYAEAGIPVLEWDISDPLPDLPG
jgi:hypothetical protein